MECYNCGAPLSKGILCTSCGANVKSYKKIIRASNACYNDALRKAGVRDLSGAIESLKMSIRLNKKNTDARNLLGLIYFETGEAVKAMTEWVISKNYQPTDNRASLYLKEIQTSQGSLETINQTIKKYNQALAYCRQDSRDLAIIQLKRVVSMNSRFVAAHQLLALLYYQEGKYELARKCLRSAAQIDTNNTITLRYLREVNLVLKQQSPNKKKKSEEQTSSYRSGNETIIQPKYMKDTSFLGTILNLILGVVIGIAITYYLLIPGVRSAVQEEAKAEVLEANNTISTKSQTINSLEARVADLMLQIESLKGNEEDATIKNTSYEQLALAYQYYQEEDTEKAGAALANVNLSYLNEGAKAIYDMVEAQVKAVYIASMYESGSAAYNAKDYVQAAADLQIVADYDINYDMGNAIFYLAQSYKENGEIEKALEYYRKVITLYPATKRAGVAQSVIAAEGR